MVSELRYALAALIVLATPALAERPLTMEFRNSSSRPANISGIYELLPDGTSIDDNLGSSDIFAAGETITLPLGITTCTTVEIYAWLYPLAGEAREEIRGETNLCKNHVMILHD